MSDYLLITLAASPEHAVFEQRVRDLQAACEQRLLVSRAESFEAYVEARGEWNAYRRVLAIVPDASKPAE